MVRGGCKTDLKLGMYLKRCAQNMSTVLGSILPFNVHENFHVDNE